MMSLGASTHSRIYLLTNGKVETLQAKKGRLKADIEIVLYDWSEYKHVTTMKWE